jgi:hypothetical protein
MVGSHRNRRARDRRAHHRVDAVRRRRRVRCGAGALPALHGAVDDITQRYGGQPLQTSRTVVDARGIVRTDVGDQLSVIVDAPHGRVLTLLHEPRQAMIATIPKDKPAADDALSWLDDLRNFKGKATPLSDTRIIDGRTARGWALQAGGTTMELWADANDLPLSMRQQGDGGLEIDYRFEFDQPIPPELLSSDVPAGYTPAVPDTSSLRSLFQLLVSITAPRRSL